MLTAEEVVTAFVQASNPAYKAHATRKLNAYIKQQQRKGKDAAQVRAAITAGITKKRKEMEKPD